MNRRHVWIGLAIVLSTGILPAQSRVDPVNKTGKGIALKGYDPVSYFEQSKPIVGSPEITHEWNGAIWQFGSVKSRDLFKSDPSRYAPQYGGYCSWAVSNNYTADIDPEAWKIIDGKLYLNYNKSVQRKWEPEATKRITDADRNWPGLHK